MPGQIRGLAEQITGKVQRGKAMEDTGKGRYCTRSEQKRKQRGVGVFRAVRKAQGRQRGIIWKLETSKKEIEGV